MPKPYIAIYYGYVNSYDWLVSRSRSGLLESDQMRNTRIELRRFLSYDSGLHPIKLGGDNHGNWFPFLGNFNFYISEDLNGQLASIAIKCREMARDVNGVNLEVIAGIPIWLSALFREIERPEKALNLR